VLGASNVSFGLPNRKLLNTTFLAMAMHAGMTCGIIDPTVPEVKRTVLAADALLGKDSFSERYIDACRQEEGRGAMAPPAAAP
jgi:5-methyltetrahydrofolate--homocysteine methyltransferase